MAPLRLLSFILTTIVLSTQLFAGVGGMAGGADDFSFVEIQAAKNLMAKFPKIIFPEAHVPVNQLCLEGPMIRSKAPILEWGVTSPKKSIVKRPLYSLGTECTGPDEQNCTIVDRVIPTSYQIEIVKGYWKKTIFGNNRFKTTESLGSKTYDLEVCK